MLTIAKKPQLFRGRRIDVTTHEPAGFLASQIRLLPRQQTILSEIE
jgi:hypothetical protein